LNWAAEKQRRVEFDYLGRADLAPLARRVEPSGVVTFAKRRYLHAFDLDREDWRCFRLDRMNNLTVRLARFDPKPGPAPIVAVYRSITGRHDGFSMVLRVAPDAAASVGEIDGAFVWQRTPCADGWHRVTVLALNRDQAIQALTRIEGQWRLEEPDWLKRSLADLKRNLTDSLPPLPH
jgi:predicted DNA-binding transcriptional regulator YafY